MAKSKQTGWKKYWKPARSQYVSHREKGSRGNSSFNTSNFDSWLPEFYEGPTNRLIRYSQYDQMDMDHEVNAALDTIAEFCTLESGTTNLPFEIDTLNTDISQKEVEIIQRMLRQWCNLNDFNKRIFRIFRNAIKYGDQFFIRDPETYKLMWVDPATVEKVQVNEAQGKEIEIYFIQDLDLNLQSMVATNVHSKHNTAQEIHGGNLASQSKLTSQSPKTRPNQFAGLGGTEGSEGVATEVDAAHVVHLSLTEGMDAAWPFGVSILERIYKIFKQKELLEDSILIYRIHRAPQRLAFNIHVGDMPPHRAQEYLEQVKNQINQKRIPSRDGEGMGSIDAAYNPMCVSLSTKIPLLDGRELTLNELISEYEDGKENWTYSCDPVTGKVVPGPISWAGITKRDAKVIRLTFDNGESLVCTPDHKIPVLGKGFIEAGELTENDSLISYETRRKPIASGKKNKDKTYDMVFDHEINDWVFTHRMVMNHMDSIGLSKSWVYDEGKFDRASKNVIHHVDFNKYNNSPDNLVYMNKKDHALYHSKHKKEWWDNATKEETNKLRSRISRKVKKYLNDLKENDPELFYSRYENRDTSWINDMRENDPEKWGQWRSSVGKAVSRFYGNNEEARESQREHFKNVVVSSGHKAKNQEISFSRDMLSRFVHIVNTHDANKKSAMHLANNDDKFISLMKDANALKPKRAGILRNDKLTENKLRKMYEVFGYENWKDFKEKARHYNHKVVAIEHLEDTMDVGTLTIDQEERYHDYHTFAISAGIFVKNSMLENFYFTRNAEGTGSSVETIGGDMDGVKNIDDMRYFNNKMLRALAVPSSYLPTGPEDGSQPYSDGRISAAFIQEFRFDRYCKRLQRSIVDILDKEFKLYLKYRGIEFDSADFELTFSEPQNFSEYRQLEIDQMRINLFTSVQNVPFISNQYALKRYLGWTDVDMQENEELWKKENNFDKIMDEHEQLISDRDIKQMDMDDDEDMEEETDMPGFDEEEVGFDEEAEEGMEEEGGGQGEQPGV